MQVNFGNSLWNDTESISNSFRLGQQTSSEFSQSTLQSSFHDNLKYFRDVNSHSKKIWDGIKKRKDPYRLKRIWSKDDETKLVNAVLENFQKIGTSKFDEIRLNCFPNIKTECLRYKFNCLKREDTTLKNRVQESKWICNKNKKLDKEINRAIKKYLPNVVSQNLEHVVLNSMEENNQPFDGNEVSEPTASDISDEFRIEDFFAT